MIQLGFQPSQSDPCLFLHQTKKIVVLNCCDDQIWLCPDNDLTESCVLKLKNLGYNLELESQGDICSFLGIEFDTVGDRIHLSQKGLINEVITYTGVGNTEGKDTPAATVSGPVVRPTDETRARCFTNGYLRIQHDHGRCNGIEMISSQSLNKSSLFRYFMLCAV